MGAAGSDTGSPVDVREPSTGTDGSGAEVVARVATSDTTAWRTKMSSASVNRGRSRRQNGLFESIPPPRRSSTGRVF